MTGDGKRLRELEITTARITERMRADQEALRVARHEIDRRLEGMNELRDQITAERGRYVDRQEWDAKHEALELLVNMVEARVTKYEAASVAARRLTVLMIAAGSLFASLVAILANILT